MAEREPAGAQTAGSGLTRKVGHLEVWQWGAIVVGAYLVYTRYFAGKSSATSAAGLAAVPATQQQQPILVAPQGGGVTTAAGAVGSPYGAMPGTPGTAPSPGLGQLAQSGSGYFEPGGLGNLQETGTIGAGGSPATFSYVTTPAQLSSYLAGGGTAYYQPSPGVFQPIKQTAGFGATSWSALAPGTPVFTGPSYG